MNCLKCNIAKDAGIDFHPFPIPGQDTYLKCVTWAKYVYPNEDCSSPHFHYQLHEKGAKLCSQHFNEKAFSIDGKLLADAVPDVRDLDEVRFIEISTEEQPVESPNCDGDQLETLEVVTQNDEDDDDSESEIKYVKFVDSTSELMQVNMLDWAIVKSEDGTSFELTSDSQTPDKSEKILPDNITCVLQTNDSEDDVRLIEYLEENNTKGNQDVITPDNVTWVLQAQSDNEDLDSSDTNLMVDADEIEPGNTDGEKLVMLEGQQVHQDNSSYVMVETEDGPIMFLESELTEYKEDEIILKQKRKKLTPYEILVKNKTLNKAQELLGKILKPGSGPGRKRKHELPTPQEILKSDKFKLYLYNCKMCDFKCNAVKDMKEHKTTAHVKTKVDHQYGQIIYKSNDSIKSLIENRVNECDRLCEICGYNASTGIEYSNHRKLHTNI